jgi:tetratricopeptide (TPR) repeat protein
MIYRLILTQKLSRVLAGDTFVLLNHSARYLFILALAALVLGIGAYVAVTLFEGSVRVSVSAIRLEQEARQHLLQGYYSMALREANELVRLTPRDPVAHKLKAHAHFKLHEYSSAAAAFDEALRLQPDFVAAQYGKASTLVVLGDYNQAKDIYRGLKRSFPDDLAVRYALGVVSLLSNDYELAKREYEAVYRTNTPWKANAALGLGIYELRQSQGGSSNAVALFREAVC